MSHAHRLHLRILATLLGTTACDGAWPGSATPAKVSPPEAKTAPAPEVEIAKTPPPEPTPEPTPLVKPEPIAKTTMDPSLEPDPEPTLVAPPALPPRATCPSGTWCGIADPPVTTGDSVIGCPKHAGVEVRAIGGGDRRVLGSNTTLDVELTKSTRASGTAHACCYQWVQPCPGGRPLREGVNLVSAEIGPSSATPTLRIRVAHAQAAAAWMQDAGYEYASVASFARAAVELMAVGAPAELVEQCHRAALDELRHARVCAEIAWSFGAQRQAPMRVPAVAPRAATLAQLAADTFVEGCVGETIAALVLRRAAAQCDDLQLRRAIDEIAGDEERHAALAWRTLGWSIESGGPEVAAAVRAVASRARPLPTPVVGGDADPDLARCGRLDAAAVAGVQRGGWRDVIEPLLATVLSRPVRRA